MTINFRPEFASILNSEINMAREQPQFNLCAISRSKEEMEIVLLIGKGEETKLYL